MLSTLLPYEIRARKTMVRAILKEAMVCSWTNLIIASGISKELLKTYLQEMGICERAVTRLMAWRYKMWKQHNWPYIPFRGEADVRVQCIRQRVGLI